MGTNDPNLMAGTMTQLPMTQNMQQIQYNQVKPVQMPYARESQSPDVHTRGRIEYQEYRRYSTNEKMYPNYGWDC